MPRLPLVHRDDAPPRARDLLDHLAARGVSGPMLSGMAGAPLVLQAFVDLRDGVRRSALPPALTERIALAVHEWLGCDYCLVAHTNAARRLGLDDGEIRRARAGTSADPAAALIVGFARQVVVAPRQIGDDEIAALRAYGFGDRQIAEVVLVVALQVLAGSFNLVAGIEPEQPPVALAA